MCIYAGICVCIFTEIVYVCAVSVCTCVRVFVSVSVCHEACWVMWWGWGGGVEEFVSVAIQKRECEGASFCLPVCGVWSTNPIGGVLEPRGICEWCVTCV